MDYFVQLFNVDICYYLLRHVFYSTLWCHRIKVFFSLDILSHSKNKGEAWNSFKTYCTSRPRKHLTFLYVINVSKFELDNKHLPRQPTVIVIWFINLKRWLVPSIEFRNLICLAVCIQSLLDEYKSLSGLILAYWRQERRNFFFHLISSIKFKAPTKKNFQQSQKCK